MSVVVDTRDCASLTDTELDDLAAMGGSFGIGAISKAKGDWVLFTSAHIDGKLHGFTFSTLERIGGTPCVLLGMLSTKRTGKRDSVLKGLMGSKKTGIAVFLITTHQSQRRSRQMLSSSF